VSFFLHIKNVGLSNEPFDVKKIFAFFTGTLVGYLLWFCNFAVPSGISAGGHYSNGSAFLNSIFASYGVLLGVVWPVIYGVYAVVAITHQRRLGLRLFAAHYIGSLLSFVVTMTMDSNEPAKTLAQLRLFFTNPLPVSLLLLTFIGLNFWYLKNLNSPASIK
jgi:hypothetical protein